MVGRLKNREPIHSIVYSCANKSVKYLINCFHDRGYNTPQLIEESLMMRKLGGFIADD